MSDSVPSRGRSGAVQILVATAIGGGAGYILTIVAGRALGPSGYATYAVFWSGLYLVISAISGIQQEVTRATHPATAVPRRGLNIRNFALVAALIVMAVTLASSPLWTRSVFPTEGFAMVWPLAVGLAAYVIVATIAGILYGLQIWRFIAVMIGVDGVLRLVIVGIVLIFTKDPRIVAWGVVAPFVLIPLFLWFFIRTRVVGRFALDVRGYRELSWNIVRTVIGAAAIGILVSGFPLLLGATSATDPRTQVATLIFAINLTRAPIVIVVLALQSFLVIYFRTRLTVYWRHLGVIVAGIAALTLVVTVLVAWLGPWVLGTFFGSEYVLSGPVLGGLVGSAGAVGVLCATGPAVLALSRHALYTAGWVIAALVTVVMLLLPLPLYERTILALWIGPLAGLVIHAVALLLGARKGAAVPSTDTIPLVP